MKHKYLDFFAGSGLVAEALSGYFQTVWANDICEKKAKVFRANHGDGVFHLGPIENVTGDRLPAAHLAWASFPCQDLSLAGNMGGLRSSRSGLVWQWLRVMDEMAQRPPVLVAENVLGLVSLAKGEHYRTLHNELIRRGYRVGALVVDALHWVPQSRKRVFVLAASRYLPIEKHQVGWPIWCHPPAIVRAAEGLENWVFWRLPMPRTRRTALESVTEFAAPCDPWDKQEHLLSLIPEKHRRAMADAAQNGVRVFPAYKRIRHGRQVMELRFDGVAGCLRTPGGGSSRQHLVIKENGSFKTRLLTVREAAALMGAPEHYKIPGTYNEAYKAMGDAVAVPVVRFLARNLLYPLSTLADAEGLQ